MQNQMAADQANAGIEGQNRSMALNIANMNQADASAVEDRRMAGMQGIANKLANQFYKNIIGSMYYDCFGSIFYRLFHTEKR